MMIAYLCSRFESVLSQLKSKLLAEDGQDLVEYAMIIAILSFCAIAAEKDVATSIAAAYNNLAAQFITDLN